jgi:hypothetical protein
MNDCFVDCLWLDDNTNNEARFKTGIDLMVPCSADELRMRNMPPPV